MALEGGGAAAGSEHLSGRGGDSLTSTRESASPLRRSPRSMPHSARGATQGKSMVGKNASTDIAVDLEAVVRDWAKKRRVPPDLAARLVSSTVRAAKTELRESIPSGTPGNQTWKARQDRSESPTNFVLRVYGEAGWLQRGLTLTQLRARDASLVHRLYAWVREKNPVPPELGRYLPLTRVHATKAISPKSKSGFRGSRVTSDNRPEI